MGGQKRFLITLWSLRVPRRQSEKTKKALERIAKGFSVNSSAVMFNVNSSTLWRAMKKKREKGIAPVHK